MNKTMRRLVAATLTAAMAVSFIPAIAAPSTSLMVDNITINKGLYATTSGVKNAELRDGPQGHGRYVR